MKRIVFILAVAGRASPPRWRGSCRRRNLATPRPDGRRLASPETPPRGGSSSSPAAANRCHKSPGQDDPLRLGGGLALKTPFGTFHAPNISTDPVDGIGAWRPVDIANALLSGVFPDGSHFYPAFPYPSYQRMTPKDVADLVAFLRTLPAVPGRCRQTILRFRSPFAGGRLMEAPLFRQCRPSSRPLPERTMEPRPLSRRRPRPLRRMSHPAWTSRREGRDARARGRALA